MLGWGGGGVLAVAYDLQTPLGLCSCFQFKRMAIPVQGWLRFRSVGRQ
jgi:hypothetical protein